MKKELKNLALIKILNLWPPYLGAGIKVIKFNPEFTDLIVRMKLRFWNRNYVGTHFGGSLYSMVDPMYMLMLMQNLGPGYIVWDKSATIRFLRPGKATVLAHFVLSPEKISEIKMLADTQRKVEPTFTVLIKNTEGEVVAEVDKIIYVRKK